MAVPPASEVAIAGARPEGPHGGPSAAGPAAPPLTLTADSAGPGQHETGFQHSTEAAGYRADGEPLADALGAGQDGLVDRLAAEVAGLFTLFSSPPPVRGADVPGGAGADSPAADAGGADSPSRPAADGAAPHSPDTASPLPPARDSAEDQALLSFLAGVIEGRDDRVLPLVPEALFRPGAGPQLPDNGASGLLPPPVLLTAENPADAPAAAQPRTVIWDERQPDDVPL